MSAEFGAGAMAGLIASFIVHPVDTFKSRKLSGRWAGSQGMVSAMSQIARQEGPRALYRGFGAVALITTPANGIYFGSYEAASKWLDDKGVRGTTVLLLTPSLALILTG